MTQKNSSVDQKIISTLARQDDGTIQITFTIPAKDIAAKKEVALQELAKEMEIPGFRKGMAPVDKIREKVDQKHLIEHILNLILPQELAQAFSQYKIQPVMYPKLELLNAEEEKDWQVRITTCEMPEVKLGNYKQAVASSVKTEIWTPDKKAQAAKKPEVSLADKEQLAIKAILETTEVKIPRLLIEEEINGRLSRLLAQIEKLGLTLDGYLASIGKTSETLRSDYEKEASEALKLELALNKIAAEEKVEVKDSEIDSAITASSAADPNLSAKLQTPEQRRVIAGVLKRRTALSQLLNLIP